MILSADLLVPSGPPPQAVLDQRPWWRVLFALLGTTCICRLVGLDVAGAVLSGVMLSFAIFMLRDGMAEVARYALVYGILSIMNLLFDILPLMYLLSGRSASEVQESGDSYTVTTESHPFFDPSEGLAYNSESIGMILSPISMLLGAFLSISAHNEIQRLGMGYIDDDRWEFPATAGVGGIRAPIAAGGGPPAYGAVQEDGQARGPSATFQRFSGRAHKLDA
mmetsp:Transcript_27464/g.60104  ORF Transcript_27464/g.60104 Transcript_27464/m.60104 type:complete len:222 (-) Transcript_27464:116-781(-)